MYTDLVLYCCCKTVYLVQSQPKLTIQITKAILVIGPAAIEVNRAIQSPLKHCPPPTGVVWSQKTQRHRDHHGRLYKRRLLFYQICTAPFFLHDKK